MKRCLFPLGLALASIAAPAGAAGPTKQQCVAANEAALHHRDAEGLHQMRVGIRRLRAAMSIFKRMLSGSQATAIKSELKWLAGELGPAREVDVFVSES